METDDHQTPPRKAALRIPPNNQRAEESLLGAMMLSADAIGAALDVLGPNGHDRFYRQDHAKLFQVMVKLFTAGQPVDSVTLADELKRAGWLDEIGGPSVLLDYQATTPAISNAGYYATIIGELADLRDMIRASSRITEMAYDVPDDVAKAKTQAEQIWFDALHGRHASGSRSATAGELLGEFWADYDRRCANFKAGGRINGMPTGLATLDERIDGLQPGSVVVVGGRPGSGKTVFALNLATNAALTSGKRSLYFTLEVPAIELQRRLVVSRTCMPGVEATKIKRGLPLSDAETESLDRAAAEVLDLPMTVEWTPKVTIGEIRAAIRKNIAKYGDLGVVVIDHVGLAGTRQLGNRTVELSDLVIDLKTLANEFGLCLLVLAQLNRSLENRPDKRPMLADLRETGELEQSADVVIFLYREAMYNKLCERPMVAELDIAKFRDGASDLPPIEVAFLPHFMRFADLDTVASTDLGRQAEAALHRDQTREARRELADRVAASIGTDSGSPVHPGDVEYLDREF